MNAKKCDRCGKFYDMYDYKLLKCEHGNTVSIWNIKANGYEEITKRFDLCKSCMTELEKFLGMNKETEKDDKKGNT